MAFKSQTLNLYLISLLYQIRCPLRRRTYGEGQTHFRCYGAGQWAPSFRKVFRRTLGEGQTHFRYIGAVNTFPKFRTQGE